MHQGRAVPIETMVMLSRTWYDGRLDLEYQPPALDVVRNRLAVAGLTDGFWSLPG